VFNWGVKLTDFEELFVLAGRGDVGADGQIHNPGDPVAQTASILAELEDFIVEYEMWLAK
jgi:2-iminobutanoate/2-iminopropanoate deaminase